MNPINLPVWQTFLSSIDTHSALILCLLILLNFIFVVFFVVDRRASKKFRHKYLQLLEGLHTENLEEMVLKHRRQVIEALGKADTLEKGLKSLDEKMASVIQKVGMVRYNAFPGLGSDQSFSVALLDSWDDGIIVTSIFGRDDSRVFAKPIKKGQSPYPLSDEELLAIERARQGVVMGNWPSGGEGEDSS